MLQSHYYDYVYDLVERHNYMCILVQCRTTIVKIVDLILS